MQMQLGWMAGPMYAGDYPDPVKQRLPGGLPSFSTEQKAALRGSADFFALNFYTAYFVMATQVGSSGFEGSGPSLR